VGSDIAFDQCNYGSATVPLWVSLQEYPQFGNGGYGGGNGVIIHGYPGGDSEYSSLQPSWKTPDAALHHPRLVHLGQTHHRRRQSPLGFVGFHNGSPQDWKNMNLEHSVSPQKSNSNSLCRPRMICPLAKGAHSIEWRGQCHRRRLTINEVTYSAMVYPSMRPSLERRSPTSTSAPT